LVRRNRGSADVLINAPFDTPFERQYLALIAGLVSLGLNPRSVLELSAADGRLGRLVKIIRTCRFSVHDLSRVQLARRPPFRVPRFNMPFELGLAVAVAQGGGHDCFLLEAKQGRLTHTLNDMNAFDASIHEGTVDGMVDAILDHFGDRPNPPLGDKTDILWVYRGLRRFQVKNLAGKIYRRHSFRLLVVTSRQLVDARRGRFPA
jgi:hypothetical protein